MRPLRICHQVNELLIGGGSIHVAQLLSDLKKLGHEVLCATYQLGPIEKLMLRDGIPVHYIHDESLLRPVFEEWRPDIVHGHSAGGGSPAIRIAQCLGIRAGETVHSCCAGQMVGDFEVVETTHQTRLRPDATLIRWAFNEERFKPTGRNIRAELGIPGDAYVIGRNGRLDASKAPNLFVEVLARLPNCYGLMVGDGVEYGPLQQLAAERGCADRLRMPGFQLELGDYFAAMNCVVYPTFDESVCAGVHEPLFNSLPVICFPVGGMGETILDRWSGLHSWSVRQMAEQVQLLIDNPNYARQLGQAGRVQLHLNGQDDPAREARLHADLYQKVLDQ